MLKSIERFRVFLIVRAGLLFSPGRVLETIRTFASTEADTAWQLIHGANRFREPQMRVRLFPQILEETEHAEIFGKMYRDLTQRKMTSLTVEKKPLYERDEDLWKLLLYCRIGEADAVERLGNIAHAVPEGPIRRTLERILAEEAGHVELADELMRIDGVAPERIARESKRIRLRRRWEAWLRAGQRITGVACTLLLWITYHLAGPVFRTAARRGLVQRSQPFSSISFSPIESIQRETA